MSAQDNITVRNPALRRLADFDEQLWPVNCAILILAGIVAGLAVAGGDFQSANPWENTVLRLLLVALTTVILLAGTLWLEGRLVRRLQLCILISLMAHLWLGIYLHQRYITMTAVPLDKKPIAELEKDSPRLKVPEYHWQRIDRPLSRPSFERPTESEPARPADPKPLEERQLEHEPRSQKPTVEPEPRQPQQPKPADVERAELTAPRRAEAAAGAQISRSRWLQQPLPNRPIPQPQMPAARNDPAPRPADVSPSRLAAANQARRGRQTFDVDPADTIAQTPIKPSRRAAENLPPEKTPTTPTASRTLLHQPAIAADSIAMPTLQKPKEEEQSRQFAAADQAALSRESTVPAPATDYKGQPSRLAGEIGGSAAAAESIGAARLSRVARRESPQRDVSEGIPSPMRGPGRALAQSPADAVPQIAAWGDENAAAGPSEKQSSSSGEIGGERRVESLTPGDSAVPAKQQIGGLGVRIAAANGPGGLSYEPSSEVGIPTRRARPESEIVHALPRRFILERSGGRLPVDGDVQEPAAKAFRQRNPGRRRRAVEVYGGSEATERAVELGLEFFVRHQFPDGHWSLHRHTQKGKAYENAGWTQTSADTAATGLSLLSFFGAGYTHKSDKHRDTVRRGLQWLLKNQKPDGDLFSGGADYTWFYSHGIASIALCEAYGMTNDPELRRPAQKAVEFIVASQHPDRGGWRYRPRMESDTSVSGWQLMALKSAQMAGIKVPPAVLDKVSHWLDTAQTQDGGLFVYNPNAPDTDQERQGRRPNAAMTAEGTLMRMYLGRKSDHPATIAAAAYLAANPPRTDSRDAYYWYYATQVMFHMQGDYWKDWNRQLREVLEDSQRQQGTLAGSWDPDLPSPDRWGHAGGRIYLTAMNLLTLEVYYRHLPLFQTLSE